MKKINENLTFRKETQNDHYAVEEMTREAFWQFWEPDREVCDEHLLVHKLRDCAALVPELNIVAELDGKLVGHIIFTKSRIESDDGKTYETLTFGPLTVLPSMQGRGIGRALMKHAFEKATQWKQDESRGTGVLLSRSPQESNTPVPLRSPPAPPRAVLIFGHPDYYPKVGFRRALEFGITTPEGKSFDAFMAYPLYEGALDGIQGKYYIDKIYEELTQEEALEFDKRFPPKKPHTPVSLDVLLKRLDQKAAKTLQQQEDITTFDMIKAYSERYMASLFEADADKTIATIKELMNEHGYPWGD